MDRSFYNQLADDALANIDISNQRCEQMLTDPDVQLMPLLNAAYEVRQATWGNTVQVHILNNAQNGKCPEDCSYCSQAKTSEADIEDYRLKPDDEILAEAQRAYEAGAFRYCLVMSGRGPSKSRTEHLAQLVRKIKTAYPIEVCVSAGLLDDAKAKVLADAGLDRMNHNLNTSEKHYGEICTTHTYQDRIETLQSAKRNGLETCSGVIAGMGEPASDLIEIAKTLRALEAESIPVNFLLPFEGNVLVEHDGLTPEYCLKVLAMYRFTNPKAEVRCTAGREFHLRSLEALALYPANSLFLDGYLNAKGATVSRTYQMIHDAGFDIVSDRRIEDLIAAEVAAGEAEETIVQLAQRPMVKDDADLHPTR